MKYSTKTALYAGDERLLADEVSKAVKKAFALSGEKSVKSFSENMGRERKAFYGYVSGKQIPNAVTLLMIANATPDPVGFMADLMERCVGK